MTRAYRDPSPQPPARRDDARRPPRWSLARYVLVVAAATLAALTVAGRFAPRRPAPRPPPRAPAPRGAGVVHIPAIRRDATATIDGRAIARAPSAPAATARGCWRLATPGAGAVDHVRCQLPAGASHLFEVSAPGGTPDRWRIDVPSDSREVTLVH